MLSVFIFLNAVNVTSVSAADDDLEGFLWDLFGSLNSDSSFGFGSTDQIVFSNRTWDAIDITFPIVTDWTDKINTYNIRWSNISMESDSGWSYDSDSMINQTFEDISTSSSTTTVTLKDLKEWITYYITISPINKDGVSWNISKEISFSLDGTTTTTDTTTNTTTTDTTTTQHWSANPNMQAASVSYQQNGKNITMTWTSLAWASEIEISYSKIWQTNMTVAWKTNMSNWTYTFTVPEINTYIVKLQPLENNVLIWTEIHQTIHMVADATTTTTTTTTLPGPTTYPTTWPAENIIAVILWAALVYGLSKLWRRV